MYTVQSRIDDSYFAIENNGGRKLVVLYRHILTENDKKVFVKLHSFEEHGKLEYGYEVLQNVNTEALIPASEFLNRMTNTYRYETEPQFELFYDAQSRCGFILSAGKLQLANLEVFIKSIESWEETLSSLGPSKLSPNKAIQVFDNFVRRSNLFQDKTLFKFLRETYKALRTHIGEIEMIGKAKFEKIMKNYAEVEQGLLNGDKDTVNNLLEANFPLLATQKNNLMAAQDYLFEKYKIIVDLKDFAYEEVMALPFETKKTLMIGYIQSTIQAYSKEKQEQMDERLDLNYSVMLQLLKNLGHAKPNDGMIDEKYLSRDANFGRNAEDMA